MKPPHCPLCSADHYSYQPHIWKDIATNTNEHLASASNTATNGATNNDRGSATNNSEERIGKPTQGSIKAVAKVEPSGKEGFQRSLRNDGAKPVDVPSSSSGQGKQGDVEDDRMERGLDSSGRRTLNRRSREAYNAYQRDYMRRKRRIS